MIRFIKVAIKVALFVLLTLALDYPVAAFLQHGLNPQFWPAEVLSPRVWFGTLLAGDLATLVKAYSQILMGASGAFANGGWSWQPFILPTFAIVGAVVSIAKPPEVPRDPSNLFGSARFANDAERAAMREGLELGIDRKTGCAVRVSVEGTLVTIAPPRTGKTSGLIIPNLAYPEVSSWAGPAIVIDPKGEVYRAVADRRRALGRHVICLDPNGLVGGADRWNPLASLNKDDVFYLLRVAGALLPEQSGTSENAAYFRNQAVALMTGAMLVALNSAQPTIVEVQRLLTDDHDLVSGLKNILGNGHEPAAATALAIMESDKDTRDPIKSTTSQAFQWLFDRRMANLVCGDSFKLSNLSTGQFDLFVVFPSEDAETLAPFIRWFLSDLFNAVRRNRARERIVVFLDEASALGRFSEILNAATELPGYGLSLWTFWQNRTQISDLYGENGAATILNTAEIVTVSNVSAVDPDESDRWSRAIGNYTARVESWNQPTDGTLGASKSQSPQAAPLMSKEDLITMPANELLAFPNSAKLARHPLRLRKTVSFADRRFADLIHDVAPAGKSR